MKLPPRPRPPSKDNACHGYECERLQSSKTTHEVLEQYIKSGSPSRPYIRSEDNFPISGHWPIKEEKFNVWLNEF